MALVAFYLISDFTTNTGGFVAVHRPTWVGTTGCSVLAWLMREPAASTLQYSLALYSISRSNYNVIL